MTVLYCNRCRSALRFPLTGVDEAVVAADRNPLIAVVKVVVVKGIADGQALDDEGRKVGPYNSAPTAFPYSP